MKHDNDNLPQCRDAAKTLGIRHFFTGQPCKKGHISKRYVSTGQCASCQYLHRIRWRTANPDKEAESRLYSVREWTKRNPERKRQLAQRSNAKPEVSANNVLRARRWAVANPDRANELRQISNRNRRSAKKGAEGRHTTSDITALLQRQKYKCAECSTSVRMKSFRHIDHIVPLSRGGSNWPTNLQVLCPPCNLKKAAKDPIDFARSKGRLL